MDVESKTTNVVEPQANASGAPAESLKPMSTEDLLAQVSRLQASNERLLEESKRNKSGLREYKEKFETVEKASLEEKGKYKELYEAEKAAREAEVKARVHERVMSSVESAAAKYGCVDHRAALKLGNPSLLQFDSSNGEVVGIDTFYEDLKKNSAYLFNSARPASVNPMIPGGSSVQRPLTATEIARLPPAERQKIMTQLMLAKRG